MKYNSNKIEKHWQRYWAEKKFYRADNKSAKPKKYILAEFPYPSGEGLHMGHLRPYVAGDVYSRYMRMKGNEVMYPIGWDAFGLPAENFAIKNKIHPRIAVEQNIKNAKKQIESWGISFDWSREVNTTDPEYYKWTQWIFLQLYKAGLAYEKEGLINWCPKDKTGLANEEVVNGACERCGTKVEKKNIRQWYLKITEYADKLIDGLEELDWPEPIKLQQKNWIGRSDGAMISFQLVADSFQNGSGQLKAKRSKLEAVQVFTTRPDTLFGAMFLVVSPERAQKWIDAGWLPSSEVKEYITKSLNKSELERQEEAKDKTGVDTGIKAINPGNNEKIPVWVADYVLGGYGTGAIMAVPAHDNRDFEFAKKFKLPIRKVIVPKPVAVMPRNLEDIAAGAKTDLRVEADIWEGEGDMVNSGKFNGMDSEKARWEITKAVGGTRMFQYKLRDWVFSRQRYWGEPIPIIHCEKCGIVPVPEKDLPVTLPEVEKYEPTGTGESPLAVVKEWVNVKCPECGSPAKRETNTMPQWAGSSWYYLRYADPGNKKRFADEELLKHWLPVDVYFGGTEHTTLHLLYSRFWHLFLSDQSLVPTPEPYTKRVQHGIILGSDGEKMSKSRGNVVNPQEIVDQYGADCLRMFELFLGPHADTIAWKSEGIVGVSRFLNRMWTLFNVKFKNQNAKLQSKIQNDPELEGTLHRAIKKIGEDIENFHFNTAVSELMKLLNELEKLEKLSVISYELFVKLLAPFAPHLAEELWQNVLGHKTSTHLELWPEYDEKLLAEEKVTIVVQINGKVRDTLSVAPGLSENEVKVLALSSEKVKKHLEGEKIKRTVVVKDRLVNIVV